MKCAYSEPGFQPLEVYHCWSIEGAAALEARQPCNGNSAKASFTIVRKEVQPSKHNETAVSPGRTRKWTTGTPEGWHRKSKGWGVWGEQAFALGLRWANQKEISSSRELLHHAASWAGIKQKLLWDLKSRLNKLTLQQGLTTLGSNNGYNPRVHKHSRATSRKILRSHYWCRGMFGSENHD